MTMQEFEVWDGTAKRLTTNDPNEAYTMRGELQAQGYPATVYPDYDASDGRHAMGTRTMEECRTQGHDWGAAPVGGTPEKHEACRCGTERWMEDGRRHYIYPEGC